MKIVKFLLDLVAVISLISSGIYNLVHRYKNVGDSEKNYRIKIVGWYLIILGIVWGASNILLPILIYLGVVK